jgi:putative tryptophan/tyrosine transport system substrate-binding protein
LLDGTINEAAYRRVFTAMVQDRVDSLVVSDQLENIAYRQLIVELAAESRIPAIYPYREFVDLGGFMAYSYDLVGTYRRAADQIDQILKGTKPGEIPFYQQTHFDLVINLNAAKALGLNIPSRLLAIADDVIE